MKPQIKLAEALTPEGDLLELFSHDSHYHISSKGQQLMTTFSHGSEEELGRMACQPFRAARQPKILIGGLGMGFTLRSVVESLPQKLAHFTVAEILPEIVDWNRIYLDDFHPNLMEDPRIHVKIGPVQERIAEANESYHALLLDVDNGPSAFTGENNDSLYSQEGLSKIHCALKPGGLLAVWSAYKDNKFTQRLRKAGFDTSMVEVAASHKGKKKRQHIIWLAKKGEYESQNFKK